MENDRASTRDQPGFIGPFCYLALPTWRQGGPSGRGLGLSPARRGVNQNLRPSMEGRDGGVNALDKVISSLCPAIRGRLMVRSFILNVEQRQAIKDYLKDRPSMSSTIRQIRLRAKKLDFPAMESDIELLKHLAALKIPKGRRALDVKASFTVRHKE